jgi:hypothetical protein
MSKKKGKEKKRKVTFNKFPATWFTCDRANPVEYDTLPFKDKVLKCTSTRARMSRFEEEKK